MNNRIKLSLVIAAALALAAPAIAAAQQQPADAQTDREAAGGPVTGPGAEQQEEARKKIEAIRISRLTDTLKLDEKTAARFIPALAALEQKRRTSMMDHRMLMGELRKQLGSPQPDPAKLKETIDRFTKSQREMMRIRDKELDTAREYLSTEQLGRYLLFQQDFIREVRDIVSGMRGPRMGPGGGRGPGMYRRPPAPPAE